MRIRSLTLISLGVLFSTAAFGQVSWLDRPLRNWNDTATAVPAAPRTLAPIEAQCRTQVRNPESIADRAVTRAGWSLYGPTQSYGPLTVVTAMASVDGMCRPMQYNAFVFVRDRFAGTLAPEPMDARTDGSLNDVRLASPTELSASFARYTSRDALCCPSQTSSVQYTINASGRVVPGDVDINAVCRDDGGVVETQDNVVSGTATFRRGNALPANSILTVRIVDVSRQDTSAPVIAEQRIDLNGKQSPVPFDIAYDRSKIQDRNRYAVQAEIREGGRLLYITNTNYPVITQGSPRNVEINLAPVGGGGSGGQRQNSIRGTVTYRQRIALTGDSEVLVRLVDAANPTGPSIAETRAPVGTRQVPIPFELEYQPRDVDRQRNYELQAEIRSGNQVRFRSTAGVAVTLRGQQPDQDVEILVSPVREEPITGRTFNFSAVGSGSMQIEGKSAAIVMAVNVKVAATGEASVEIRRFGDWSPMPFTGKLIFANDTTLRIAVEAFGNANASGELQITYTDRRLRSVAATNLVVDGQNATLRF